MKQILSVAPPEKPVSDEEIIVGLGNDISALHSVPTAMYCFLKAQSDISSVKVIVSPLNSLLFFLCNPLCRFFRRIIFFDVQYNMR